jgi:hypothetical protein
VQIPFAETSPAVQAIINQSAAGAAVAAGAADGSGIKTKFGSIDDLAPYRVAFMTRRRKAQGLVTETTTSKVRGRHLTFVGYNCSITGETVTQGFARGELAQSPVTFKLYPDTSITVAGEEYGFWFDEDAQTISF